jgi:hypothetical protein
VDRRRPRPHRRQPRARQPDQGSILRNSIAAENFTDKFSSLDAG